MEQTWPGSMPLSMDVLPVDYLFVDYLTMLSVTQKYRVKRSGGSAYWTGKDTDGSGVA
jgi:hypothetical protein